MGNVVLCAGTALFAGYAAWVLMLAYRCVRQERVEAGLHANGKRKMAPRLVIKK